MRVPGAATGASLAYSCYLTHKQVLAACERHLPERFGSGTWIGFGVFLAGSLLVAAVLYLAVESPCLRLRDRNKRFDNTAAEILRDPAL